MEKQTLTKFKWFFAWNDEREEAWLGEMARQGWHLRSPGLPGWYHFDHGEPRSDTYRMDYILDRKDYANYLQLFRDAGWDHAGELGGWQYFRTAAQNGSFPEIYTDKASKAQKYRRVLTTLIVLMPIFVISVTRPLNPDSRFYDLYGISKLFMSGILMLFTYSMMRLMMRIKNIKK